jgi:phospholipase C
VGDKTIPCPKAPDVTLRDLCHRHECALTAWNGGKMDGWLNVPRASELGDRLAWAQYDESTIPNYWAYAKTYTLADHFFANMLGPSFPGHLFLLAAQAGWAMGNPYGDPTTNPPDIELHPYWGCDTEPDNRVTVLEDGTCAEKSVFPCFQFPSIPDVLPPDVTWKFYGTPVVPSVEPWSMFDALDAVRNGAGWQNVVKTEQLGVDVQEHRLPNVVWLVDQPYGDEHPGLGSVCEGENWTVGFVDLIMQSEYWDKTAILITMDDYGGWYDHVPPPRQYGCGDAPYGLGFRLPLMIVSPYARPGFVFREQAEQASIPRFIERIFGAPALSTLDPAAQDGQANDLMGAFDWTQAPLPPLVREQRSCF